MPNVSFNDLRVQQSYSRQVLAELWGYAGYNAISRGVVTPAGQNYIILFVTREKQATSPQYEDRLTGHSLYWEGPTDHFAEERMIRSGSSSDEIHLFYRDRHHSNFTYYGRMELENVQRHADKPSRFTFRLLDVQ